MSHSFHRLQLPLLPVLALLLVLSGIGSKSLRSQETVLIAAGEEWRYTKGTADPPADWNQPGFDDSGWLSGPTGIGYADADDATVLDDMMGSYISIFTRKTFNVSDLGSLSDLVLRIRYDDGFIAYLNGEEVARSSNMAGAVGPPAFDFMPTPDHEAGAAENFLLDSGFLESGENVLAVQVHNTSFTSSDLSFIPELVSNADLCPSNFTCSFNIVAGAVTLNWNNRGLYDSISIARDGTDLGAFILVTDTTYTDMLPPGGALTYSLVAVDRGTACAAVECTVTVLPSSVKVVNAGDGWSFFRGTVPPPLGWNAEFFDDSGWETGPTGIGYGDNDDLTVLDDMMMIAGVQPGYLTVYARTEFNVASLDGVQGLFAAIYDDGFIAYVNGLEIGRVNMPPDPVTETTPAIAAINPIPVDILIPSGVLRVGTNFIAVEVHNANLTSSDLSFIPVVALIEPTGGVFRRGDITNDALVNISDPVYLLDALFRGSPEPTCLDAADTNDDGLTNITDAVFLLNHLFQGTEPPPPPGLDCGVDLTPDPFPDCSTLGC